MKNASLSRVATLSLLLSVALWGSVAVAQDTPPIPGTSVTNILPAPDVPPTPRTIDPVQTKVLQEAVKGKNWDGARSAVLAGADTNIADKGGVTVLMRAADAGQSGLVELLLQNGANPNAVDKKGQSALHYAIPADSKPKKKFGLGQIMGALGGAGALNNALGGAGNFGSLLGGTSLDTLMGSNLASLLGGQAFNLGGKSGWMAIAGAALQGDAGGNFGIGQLLGGQLGLGQLAGTGLGAEGWVNLLSSVKGANPQILGAMARLGAGGNADQCALWSQFLNAASSGDQNGVTQLMQNPDLVPLLQQAMAGLSSAASELPGNSSRSIVSTLLKGGATATVADKDGKTAAALAQERGLSELSALLGAQ